MILNKKNKFEKATMNAETYSEWSEAAKEHDLETGALLWRNSDESDYYDHVSIKRRLEQLTDLLESKESEALLFALNEGIHGNMGGMGKSRLYQKAKFGTKKLIEDYTNAIAESLDYIANPQIGEIAFEDKLDFFRRAQHCYGRSALLMSGAGSFLFFHIGVAKALWKQDLLPNIISGSSGGSVVGAILCTHKNYEMEKYFDPTFLSDISVSLNPASRSGRTKRMSTEQVRAEIGRLIPDLTFQEAYELTGRHLNVSVAPAEQHQKSRLLNAIASPNVFIREAVMASCAVPGIYEPVVLAAKNHHGQRVPYLPNRKWVDGSITNDLPVKRLARLYGVNHQIVSQANPLVTPYARYLTSKWTPFNAIQKAGASTIKVWVNANANLMQRPLSYFPTINSATNVALSLMNQTYSGDINIIRPAVLWSPTKILSKLSFEDMKFLIDMGERTTWPKIEMVRTQTKISKALDQILFEYEDELTNSHGHMMRKKSA